MPESYGLRAVIQIVKEQGSGRLATPENSVLIEVEYDHERLRCYVVESVVQDCCD